MQRETLFPDTPSGRTYQGLSIQETVTTLRQSSKKWQTSGLVTLSGIAWMRSSSESPNGVDECSSSLSLILQSSAEVDNRYLLSGKAAEGILRRANKRGKTLPENLQQALEAVAHDVVHETA